MSQNCTNSNSLCKDFTTKSLHYEKLLHYNNGVEKKQKKKRGTDMKFAMIGLGKMGLNLVKNAVDNGHEVVAYDLIADSVK